MANCHSLTIFQMNHSHGYLEPHQELFWSGDHAIRCLGENIYFKAENPPGIRIQEFFVSGRRLVPDEAHESMIRPGLI